MFVSLSLSIVSFKLANNIYGKTSTQNGFSGHLSQTHTKITPIRMTEIIIRGGNWCKTIHQFPERVRIFDKIQFVLPKTHRAYNLKNKDHKSAAENDRLNSFNICRDAFRIILPEKISKQSKPKINAHHIPLSFIYHIRFGWRKKNTRFQISVLLKWYISRHKTTTYQSKFDCNSNRCVCAIVEPRKLFHNWPLSGGMICSALAIPNPFSQNSSG